MLLKDYTPQSKLQTKTTSVNKPSFSVIDAHNHIGTPFGSDWLNRSLSEFISLLDQASVRVFVDLDGGWGEDILQKHIEHFKAAAPERFVHFGGIDWSCWTEHGVRFPDWAANRLREQVRWGAQGLKIWKKIGLNLRDPAGNLVRVDDNRLEIIWETAAELEIPVTIHVADPIAFFEPLDQFNERWEELDIHPEWHFPSPPYPPFATIIEQFATLILRHPKTTFIGAHVGCYAENLAWVSELLDRAPNFYIDISARISELGRQPYTARRFFITHSDRILFGTDMGPNPETYRIYYRFLETEDEYFNYSSSKIPPQGRWQIYGVGLSDEILEKVYSLNAQRLLGIN
jgi:predicted TIM-barrel fold metal-dependent hydrolase